ncbi:MULTISPECIES: AbrB family transcriptional regulator [Nostocales]|uniref:AbrB family transcriptional regulator n=3 Tax=Nostocales TaxID=1161 RepID=A0A0C1MXM4_9CYAN|nr:AbrB family transcriptional regulator [Tolypothrix bouteillei]KAF3889492.1 AbrB family transcriptional regulator [Tolypothrix bouteillei VB521301]
MNQTLTVSDRQQINSETKSVLTKQQIPGKQLVILVLEMLLALPLGLLLAKFHIGGVAWIFGGIISGAIVLQTYRIFYQDTPKPNRTARKTGMALVGLNVGFSISHGHLTNAVSSFPVFAFLTFFLLLSGIVIGYIYSRLSKTNLLTALLATVPGGVGMMSAIAADYNRNVPLVAMVQAIRVTTVVFLIPLIARMLSGNQIYSQTLPVSGTLINLELTQLGLLLISLLFGTLGVYIAVLGKIPAGEFFGAIVAGIVFNPTLNLLPFGGNSDYALPPLVNIIGQMLLGITIGEYWGDKPTLGKKTIAYAFVSVAMTLLTGVAATIFAMQLTSWDWLTCLLVTAPGGSAEMILVALTLHHNVEIVTAGHLVRLIAINSSLPLWLYLFSRLDD